MGARMLLFSSLFLMALPWLGYRYIDEMKNFLVLGQEDAQLLTARAVASVLHGRAELFYQEGEPADIVVEDNALYVYPLDIPVEVDGYAGDWDELQHQARSFAAEFAEYLRDDGPGQAVSFSLLLGEHGKYFYVLVQVKDGSIVYRHPQYRRLDHSDHVRLEFVTAEGQTRRLMLITEGEGQVSVYDMKPDWKTPDSGRPVNAVTGIWRENSTGYRLEIRMPGAWLGSQPQMKISVASVDDASERRLDSIVSTRRNGPAGRPNMLVRRSPELDRIVEGLGDPETGLCVVDRYRRVRGVYGRDYEDALCVRTDTVSDDLVRAALEGDQSVVRYQNPAGETVIVAAHPVHGDDQVLGAVLVEKNSSRILGLQHASLMQLVVATFIVFLVAVTGLLLFAAWLAYRIRKLQKEASLAIDADGRIVSDSISAEQYAADEIGQLSRDFSALLSRLKSYTGFLESVPRTLRHEILNPVNTISMSLQKLQAGTESEAILNSARKASRQLEMIVHSLTEAAHIEDVMLRDEHRRFDLASLVTEYIGNMKQIHGDARFRYEGPADGICVTGNDLRIAQLLDKLTDNALGFSSENDAITIRLERDQDTAVLSVENSGPHVSDEIMQVLFTGMVSSRPGERERPHLGIGLYIAGRIARLHRGELGIANLDNPEGVRVSLRLPLVK